jgi:hypothetical protein
MNMKERNKYICNQIRKIIDEEGLTGKLDVFPVENTFTRRPLYWNDGETNLFKVLMWTVNKLSDEDLDAILHCHVANARAHFGL